MTVETLAAQVTAFSKRDAFDLPDGVVYLDGNSLGPLPSHAPARIAEAVKTGWGEHLITCWNVDDWVNLPITIGERIAPLIGAEPGTVRVCDSTSINVHKVLAAALALQGNRGRILSDTGNFPTDLYVAQSIAARHDDVELLLAEPEAVFDLLGETVSVLMLTQVDYRTGRKHDMAALTARAHELGALVIWDLAHSAGAFGVDLAGCDADFAVGCGYKYLNGGPGAPAFLYVAPRHHDVAPDIAGWFGHQAPFAFDIQFEPATGIDRFRVGTPPVLSMIGLDAALDLWDGVEMARLEAASRVLSERFIERVEDFTDHFDLRLGSPRDAARRGSQVSFHHCHAYPIMQALIARGVVGDMRAPDFLRFGFAPLYNTVEDIDQAADILRDILTSKSWDQPRFHARKAVT